MKIPLFWISAYTDINTLLISKWAKDLAHLYSIHTAEIDGIERIGYEDRVVVARVISTAPHPNSDHLNLVELDVGPVGTRRIVCGAENVRSAKYVAVALEGARLGPDRDFEIKLSKIRGEESQGMICSEDELGLQEERSAGIMPLENSFDETYLESKLGTPFYALEVTIPGNGSTAYRFPIQDTIFEIDNKFITNRPDLFGVHWNAREFGAVFSLPFKEYKNTFESPLSSRGGEARAGGLVVAECGDKNGLIWSNPPSPLSQGGTDMFSSLPTIPARIESKNVLAYSLLSVSWVHVKKSPIGIELMLRKSGLSPKYDLVDITNFIMTELGQPMHVFDADKVVGTIIVREARAGEKILALDNKEYELAASDIVIADEQKVLAIAGVIGGLDSAVTESTTNIIFESATFDAVTVRLTAQRLGIRTDASMRYEKSLDPLLPAAGLARALELLWFLGKKSVPDGGFSFVQAERVNHITIETDMDFIRTKIGTHIPDDRAQDILTRLGFDTQIVNEKITTRVPSWRASKDINIREDIAEEIGRVYGYDNVPNTPVHGPLSIARRNPDIELRNRINAYFSAQGLFEVYNYSFSNGEKDAKIGFSDDSNAVHIKNAFNVEYTVMRRSLIGNLLSSAETNLKRSESFGFFEIGKIFFKRAENDFTETKSIAGVLVNRDLASLRAILDGFLRSIVSGVTTNLTQGTDIAWLHPNKSGIYTVDGAPLISFGSLHPQTAAAFGLSDARVLVFEIDAVKLASLVATASLSFSEIPKYPGVTRELNFVLAERTPVQEVIEKIAHVSPLLSDFSVADIFRDEQKVGVDKKSVTFSFTIRNPEKTITDEEALAIQNTIIKKLEKEGVELRK